MIVVSTIPSNDGVIGLNGKQYLLDNNDELMLFESIDKAKHFLEEPGEDPDNEYINYEKYEEENDNE